MSENPPGPGETASRDQYSGLYLWLWCFSSMSAFPTVCTLGGRTLKLFKLEMSGTTKSCQRSWKLEENPYNQWNHGDGGPHHSLTNKLCSYRVDQSTGNQAKRAAMKTHESRVERAAAAFLWGGNVGSLNPAKLPSRTPPNRESLEWKEIGRKVWRKGSHYKGTRCTPVFDLAKTLKHLYFSKMVIILIDVWVLNLPSVPEISLIWSGKLHIFPSFSWKLRSF